MANTENIEAKLCAYIDGDLDAAGRAEIEKHLAANPQHRGLIEQLSKQRDLLRELPRESAPEEILDALQSQMERSVLLGDADAAAEAEAMKIHRWPQLLAAAAIVILTVGLGAVIYFVLPRNASTGNYARVAESGATLDEAKTSAEPDAVDVMGGATEGRRAGTIGKSATRVEASATAPAAAGSEPRTSVAMAPAADATAPEAQAKEKSTADVFAPARGKAGEREADLAKNELLDAQYRLQNADLARQLKDTPGGLQDNAMFVVVSTADASAARSEVTNYLASNKIAWDSVSHPVPEPLAPIAGQDVYLSRSQNVNVRMKQGPAQVAQQGAAPEAQQQQQQQQNKLEAPSGVAGAATTDAAAQRPAEPAADQFKDSLQRPEQPGVADAGQRLGQPFQGVTNTAQVDPGLQQATTQTQQPPQVQQAVQPIRTAQTGSASRLIIARGMTKQQAAELSSNLSKQTTVQRAAVYEQRPLPAAAPAVRSRTFTGGGGGGAGATTVPAATTEPTSLVEELAAVPSTRPTTTTTYSDAREQAADAAPTTREAALPTTTTAPAPIPLGTSGAVAVAEPATRPVGASDERVDVVILVEDDVAPAVILEQTDAPAAAQPIAAPTTNPAANEAPAPSTQPAPSIDAAP